MTRKRIDSSASTVHRASRSRFGAILEDIDSSQRASLCITPCCPEPAEEPRVNQFTAHLLELACLMLPACVANMAPPEMLSIVARSDIGDWSSIGSPTVLE